ncbi:MAG TPA: Xaa-Pro peptidase family protein [Thermomicrobiales bacterium]|nr:Xaa-Pro peptidase family protein [Thermomicrobiales bacterium]
MSNAWDDLAIPIEQYVARRQRCRVEASARGFAGLIVLARDPDRAGNGLYLANHRPIAGSHPSMYGQRGRGYCAIVIPVDREETLLVTSPYYEPDVTVGQVAVDTNLPRGLAMVIEGYRLERGERWGIVGEEFLPVLLHRDITTALPYCSFYFADDILWSMRAIKDEFEQAILREAAVIADAGSASAMTAFRAGRTENQVVADIDATLRSMGAQNTSLTCQSGVYRSGEPLIRPFASERVLAPGDMAQLEIRGTFKGYGFDICRSAVVGPPDDIQRHMFETVDRMLDAIISKAAPGVRAEQLQDEIDAIAHAEGFDGYQSMRFGGPSTYCGHGLGVASDEPPVLFSGDKTILRPGMFLTPEPGLYRHPRGGLRLEDNIIVTEDGCENLNTSRRWWWSDD